MDPPVLEKLVQELFAAGLAPGTQRNYRSGERRYLRFCADCEQSPFPVDEQVLSTFVAYMYQQGLSVPTMKSYLAAVRHKQIALGLGDPVMSKMPQLQYVLKGVKRKQVGKPKRVRLPITLEILGLLHSSWQHLPSRSDAAMLWAAATLCFFAFLRMGEVVVPSDSGFDPRVHLAYGDVRVNSTTDPQWMEVHIKQSKCDQFGSGVKLAVGVSGAVICPVAAMLGYLIIRKGAPGPLFQFEDGHPLTRARFVDRMRSALREVGIDSSLYAGHSFRIGAATTAASRGLQDSLIKTLGRWESSAYMLYVRTPRATLTAVSRHLVQS